MTIEEVIAEAVDVLKRLAECPFLFPASGRNEISSEP